MTMIRFAKSLSLSASLLFFVIFASVAPYAQISARDPQSRDRVKGAIDDQDVAPLAGSAHPAARTRTDLGRVESDTTLESVTLVFKLSPQQQQDRDTLMQQQQDTRSANYHTWLTPAQYQSRFGVSESDLATVKAWLQSHGLTVNESSSDRSTVVFSGTASQIEEAFHTQIHRFIADGETNIANASEVSVPRALSSVVLGVRGLNDFRPHPRPHLKQVKSAFTSSISGNHFLAPDDFATIYNLKPLYNKGIDGTGQKIAIVGQSDIQITDIQKFRSVSGLPASDPQVILVPGATDPGIVKGDVIFGVSRTPEALTWRLA